MTIRHSRNFRNRSIQTENDGSSMNDQILKKWERVERGRARNEVVPSRSQGTSTAQERDF